MSSVKLDRRQFLKMLGVGGAGTALAGCDLPTTITLEEGKEEVVSYLLPEEYVIPGVGVYFASTCTQCNAGCGIHGRVREGRVLKIEGNPDSPVNTGKTCMMGQAGVQTHFNPDRITAPMMRKSGRLQTVTWDEATAELNKHVGAQSNLNGGRFAWVTGSVSGHQSVLINELMAQLGSTNHYAHEVVNASVWSAVCQDMLGDAMPRLRIDKAGTILSLGADFLGTWISPVHFAREYAKFRSPAKRGVLVQVETKMSLTGGNADLWVPARAGTEGILALGIANFMVDRGWNKVEIPAAVRAELAEYKIEKVAELTGVAGSKIQRIASLLSERAPGLVLAGAPVESSEQGYASVSAAMLLNIIIGAVGTTIEPATRFSEKALQAKAGDTKSLLAFAKGLQEKRFDVVFISGANPVYTAPDALKLVDGFESVPFKVVFSQFPDETTQKADLVLPMYSAMEDWATHVPAYQTDGAVLSVQQPLMEPLYKDTKGFGDVVIALLKQRSKNYEQFPDYYAYLQTAMMNLPEAVTGPKPVKKEFWNGLLQKGLMVTKGDRATLSAKLSVPVFAHAAHHEGGHDDFMLVPSARMGMFDGRHANVPWIQEAPDQITKVVWDSWAELHPEAAAKLGVANGDLIRIASEHGSIETQVFIHKGIRPDVIGVPLGQGHEEYGRYAKGRGANPLKILNPVLEQKTGELAMYATKVKVSKTRKTVKLVKMGGSDTQAGRQFVLTVSADKLRRTEGEG